MLRRETGRDALPNTKIKIFNRLGNGLSDPETARADLKAN